jgi:antitoxin VapB
MPPYGEAILQRTAKIFVSKGSQAVRLPKEFQFATSEVFIRKQGAEVILSPRPEDWSSYLISGPVASEEFMEQIEDLPAQDRHLRRIRSTQPVK